MGFSEISERRNLLLLAGCVALIQVACYYFAAATVRGDGALAIAQPDTLLYCQAARRIAEGFPFSFSAGTAVSTGTTSVLYPYILAVPYLLGFKGSGLLLAGLGLNAIFYLLFVIGWGLIACQVFDERPRARILSVALVAAFGPFAYCALAQSDIGLWLAVSAWIAYGLCIDRKGLYVPLLLLAPWIRPEGMILVAAYCAFCAVESLRRRRLGVEAAIAAAAVVSSLGVFALNYALTGVCQFSSVARKGYFTNFSFSSAVYASAMDAMKIAKAYLLGIPQDAPRDFFYLPLVGAAFLWIGVFSRSWSRISWREGVWYLAVAGGCATVATSGWQNTNLDRYLVWIMPVLLFHAALGADVVASRLKEGVSRVVPGLVLVGFSALMSFVFADVFHYSAVRSDLIRSFAARCEGEMTKGCSIGTWGEAGIAYELSSRRLAHLSGIYSPEFIAGSMAAKIEILKNEPSTRFDYWFTKTSERKSLYCDKPEVLAGETVLSGPPDYELRKADWTAFDAATTVPVHLASNLTLCAHLDVAYEKDEKAFGYEMFTRDDYPLFMPFPIVGKLNGTNIVEGGRFLLGGDAMTVPLTPARDVQVVMRTALKCSAAVDRELGATRNDFTLKSPMTLKVLVEGEVVGDISFPVAEGDVTDATFVIPGRFIRQPQVRLAFLGEHVAFAYWFFQ